MSELEQLRLEVLQLREQRDHEAWCHAACGSIADGLGQPPEHLLTWAMKAVIKLREKLDAHTEAGAVTSYETAYKDIAGIINDEIPVERGGKLAAIERVVIALEEQESASNYPLPIPSDNSPGSTHL